VRDVHLIVSESECYEKRSAPFKDQASKSAQHQVRKLIKKLYQVRWLPQRSNFAAQDLSFATIFHHAPIQLQSITRLSCTCGYYEIEIPKMGPLHEAIAQALDVTASD
jgi:hypothetical protein